MSSSEAPSSPPLLRGVVSLTMVVVVVRSRSIPKGVVGDCVLCYVEFGMLNRLLWTVDIDTESGNAVKSRFTLYSFLRDQLSAIFTPCVHGVTYQLATRPRTGSRGHYSGIRLGQAQYIVGFFTLAARAQGDGCGAAAKSSWNRSKCQRQAKKRCWRRGKDLKPTPYSCCLSQWLRFRLSTSRERLHP